LSAYVFKNALLFGFADEYMLRTSQTGRLREKIHENNHYFHIKAVKTERKLIGNMYYFLKVSVRSMEFRLKCRKGRTAGNS